MADERSGLAQQLQDGAGDRQHVELVPGADVEGLAFDPRLPEQRDQGRTMVVDVDPVAAVQAGAVDRQGLVLDRVGDEQRHQLLGVLARPVVVGAARDDHRQAPGRPVGEGQAVAACLAGGIGAARHERPLLGSVALEHFAVDFVGRDLYEAPDVLAARHLAQHEHPVDVCPNELPRPLDRAVDVGLGGKVEHEIAPRHRLLDRGGIADVAVLERQRAGGKPLEVLAPAGVGERVEHHDVGVGHVLQQIVDEVRADEAGAARDQHPAADEARPLSHPCAPNRTAPRRRGAPPGTRRDRRRRSARSAC